ncbi:MAG TPA: ABC transporter permease [Pyrinomonadaceae bacterium]|nr:ABC transporter permease [Pyrinomonadaceae bacterium]
MWRGEKLSRAAATTTGDVRVSRAREARARLASLLQRQGALVALVLVCLFASLRFETFLTEANLTNILRQNSMLGFVALGMTFVILTGGIDLSVGALLAVAGVAAATLSPNGAIIAVVGGVAAGTILGSINGMVIAKARIQPFIVTLAMMIAARGAVYVWTNENSVPVAPGATTFRRLGQGKLGDLYFPGVGLEIPLFVPVLLLVAAYILGWLCLRYTRFGRHVFALGDNEEAARLMGLNVGRVTIGVYALSGLLAGVGGVLLAARLGTGQPVAGLGWELEAIAAVVVGGTLLTGGTGGVGSTVVGWLLLAVILNLLNLGATITPWWQNVIRGIFLLAVVILQNRLAARR